MTAPMVRRFFTILALLLASTVPLTAWAGDGRHAALALGPATVQAEWTRDDAAHVGFDAEFSASFPLRNRLFVTGLAGGTAYAAGSYDGFDIRFGVGPTWRKGGEDHPIDVGLVLALYRDAGSDAPAGWGQALGVRWAWWATEGVSLSGRWIVGSISSGQNRDWGAMHSIGLMFRL